MTEDLLGLVLDGMGTQDLDFEPRRGSFDLGSGFGDLDWDWDLEL